MKSEKNILLAFLLNLAFSIFEFFGGIFSGSVAIISDSVHDMGDAVSIGISYFLEKKSKGGANEKYTYGYARYSVLGGLITASILLLGSVAVIYNAILRIIHPTPINYNGMIFFAVIGVSVNLSAALFTRKGSSINQRTVNLHMLEDALGWIVVLLGAILMRFTDITVIDPIMSICVAAFILFHSAGSLKKVLDVFLEKTPQSISIEEIKEHLLKINGIIDVHHIHVWSIDGQNHYATMHIVTCSDPHSIKDEVREELSEHGIIHSTLELEAEGEHCHHRECDIRSSSTDAGHHHHHH